MCPFVSLNRFWEKSEYALLEPLLEAKKVPRLAGDGCIMLGWHLQFIPQNTCEYVRETWTTCHCTVVAQSTQLPQLLRHASKFNPDSCIDLSEIPKINTTWSATWLSLLLKQHPPYLHRRRK